MRTDVELTSPIFDPVAREVPAEVFVGRQALDFKVVTKGRMIESRATGNLYARRSGPGFKRSHRASSVGQRPAPDTLTLVNAITDRMTSPTTAEVFVAERINPLNGQAASKYADILQFGLDRPIQSDEDAAEAEAKMLRESPEMIQKLI